MMFRIFTVGAVLGFIAASACGGSKTCDVTNCATGCCTSDGECLPGTAVTACGVSARQCSACGASQQCTTGVCVGASAVTPDAGSVSAVDAGAITPALVINEIAAKGDEFIELFNSKASVDLSNYALADSENDGGPKYDEAVRFPAGTTLATGGYVVVLTSKKDAGVTTSCPNGVSTCFTATFGISSSRGETVWLLDPTNQVVDSKHYPIGAADAGSSYGRMPSGGDGWGVITPATPGSSN